MSKTIRIAFCVTVLACGSISRARAAGMDLVYAVRDGVALRDEAGTATRTLAALAEGARLHVLSESRQGFIKAQAETGEIGLVSRADVSLTRGGPPIGEGSAGFAAAVGAPPGEPTPQASPGSVQFAPVSAAAPPPRAPAGRIARLAPLLDGFAKENKLESLLMQAQAFDRLVSTIDAASVEAFLREGAVGRHWDGTYR
ncbi:MAG: hypothetical protein BWZ10_03424 [candidate division BRC1 bacterium ADurb.BinA364]|nr:MAG: hypothetical protein BWZ10_03424 [candidate division BRC1 bacterium ADurb.BinA364]